MELDKSEELFQILNRTIVDIYKVCLEEMGYDLCTSENQIEYHNYLIDNPINFNNPINGVMRSLDDSLYNMGSSKFVDYNGPADNSIGSKVFPQGKGKCLDPNGIYWPFYIFGFGASPKSRPDKAKSKRSGIDCCKLAIETIMGYLEKGCKTIGDVICMYHAGIPTYEKMINYYKSISGINDISNGRFVSSAEMIKRQNYYQQHLVDYVHMSNKTPVTRSYKILYPLITFISRQEQGVNCEAACKIALQQMGIT